MKRINGNFTQKLATILKGRMDVKPAKSVEQSEKVNHPADENMLKLGAEQRKQEMKKKVQATKEKVKKEREEFLDNVTKVKFFSTLRFKLIASFLVPIAFIIVLGVVSFLKASNGIQSNYEKATEDTIGMAGEFMRFGFESVEATTIQYANDDNIGKYFLNMADIMETSSLRKAISSSLIAKQVTDEFIEDIYLISDKVDSISTSGIFYKSGVLAGFRDTEIGKYLNDHKFENIWDGEDAYLDEKLESSQDDYSMRLIRNIAGVDAIVVVETKADAITNILSSLEFDKSGFLGLVTSDGREIIDYSLKQEDPSIDLEALKSEKIFLNEDFYKETVTGEAKSGSKYVNYKGETYLFMYSKIGKTGDTLCALMPKSTITSQADDIKNITVIIVIIACILAVLIVAWLTTGIDKTIKGIISKLKLAAKGDLTVQFDSKRKDEFHVLIDEIQLTFGNMKDLIQQVKTLSGEVSESSLNVTTTSELFLKSAEDISSAMNEIEQGINQQAKDAEECLVQMDNLSQRIEIVSENTKEIGQIADNTKKSVKEGTVISEELNHQTKSTIEITTDIIQNIEKLADKSSSINKIINVINDIANQTNLLSLNASIEAARAGEHGKGFAVVASEIRTLAEQSKTSVNDIKKIIGSIQEDTTTAVDTARKAEKVLQLQENAVKNTTDSYDTINSSVEKLIVFLKYITDNVENIEEARVSTLGAIENISAVLEEIAASSNNVNQTATNQVASVESLNKSALNLNTNSDNLVNEVRKFIV
ncbi:MAG: hypothetical protein H6Q59_325 [Firmicutes bacterium]|nr:hypothetical protein [Bacillota bacterium]